MSTTENPAPDTATAFADGCAFIDGDYVPVAEARIPILDWGFVRSDVTYDVVAVWQGRFFRLQDHLDRFVRGISELRMTAPYDREAIAAILHGCVRRTRLTNAYVEMILTRGTPPRGSRDPRQCHNRFYAFAIPYVWIVPPDGQEHGAHLVVSRVPRIPPESVDPTVKNFHWGDMMRGVFEAYDRGGEVVVLTDGHDHITEGPGFNLFAAADGRLVTPARGVLPGITRQTVIELAEALHIAVEIRALSERELHAADEIFLSSTAGGVMPVTCLNGNTVGDGHPGPITARLRQRYWEAHEDPQYATPVDY